MFITAMVRPLFSQHCVLKYEFFITTDGCTKMASMWESHRSLFPWGGKNHGRTLSFSHEAI